MNELEWLVLKPNFQRIALSEVVDARGGLIFAEESRHIPFAVKRIFSLYDVPEGAVRGGHAHIAQHQFLMMLSGTCTTLIDDGESRIEVVMKDRREGLYIPPGLWLVLKDFSAGAICLVLASGPYDEEDYIRDYSRYLTRK
jgi:dTDP-4-dehydrorhamnose 3,5-epimerase-like enzyme